MDKRERSEILDMAFAEQIRWVRCNFGGIKECGHVDDIGAVWVHVDTRPKGRRVEGWAYRFYNRGDGQGLTCMLMPVGRPYPPTFGDLREMVDKLERDNALRRAAQENLKGGAYRVS